MVTGSRSMMSATVTPAMRSWKFVCTTAPRAAVSRKNPSASQYRPVSEPRVRSQTTPTPMRIHAKT